MKNIILGLLLIYSVTVVEASSSQQIASGESGNTYSGIAIGYNPADFSIIGKPLPGAALADMLVTGLHQSRCADENGRFYKVVVTEDPRIMGAIEKEIKLSSSAYIDPDNRLTVDLTVATHLVKGNAIFKQGSVTINLRIEDRQGNVIAKTKSIGNSFLTLPNEAARLLASQICKPKPKEKKGCPYLWDITFTQSGTLNTNRCFGSGLSDEEAMSRVEGFAYFPNVLIRPSEEYELTWKEDDLCEPYRKNDILNNYRAKSQGDTYQKIDGFDGMDLDAVYLRVLNIRKGGKKMIFEYGSVPIQSVLSKIAGFKRPEDRRSFVITEGCNQTFTFSPIPVYGN